MEKPALKNEYKIGQKVKFNGGYVGTVISIGTFGNKDIRAPYNRLGIPTIKGENFLGTSAIIPSDWPNHYGEFLESAVVSVE